MAGGGPVALFTPNAVDVGKVRSVAEKGRPDLTLFTQLPHFCLQLGSQSPAHCCSCRVCMAPRRVRLAPGATIRVSGHKSVSLRHPVDLPRLPVGYLVEAWAHARTGQAERGFEQAPGEGVEGWTCGGSAMRSCQSEQWQESMV